MKRAFFVASILSAFAVQASITDRPSGIKIGQHMTIRPYVSLYYTWDSNIDSSTDARSSSIFNIAPGFTFAYKADNWNLQGGAFYQYHAYTENPKNLDTGSWGENLAFNWTNSREGGPGWGLALRENLQMISQDDDMTNDGGRGVGRDRMQLQFAGTIQRRFTERWHGDVDVSYYYLDYKNDAQSYAPLYGWTRWTVGAQAGYAASKWTDFIIAGNYQGYTQDNDRFYNQDIYGLSRTSQGWTLHAGIGTHATEKISYRVTGGYSQFRYSDGDTSAGSFTYTASGQWRINDTWNTMLLASRYYQPDETQFGSLSCIDSVSWGLSHSMIRNKLTATLDFAYRHQDRQNIATDAINYDNDIITARLGLNYVLNRFVSIFGNAEYQTAFYKGNQVEIADADWDYDRWRLSVGFRLTY